MQPINEVTGFPPLVSDMEILATELRATFRYARPTIAGIGACCLALIASLVLTN